MRSLYFFFFFHAICQNNTRTGNQSSAKVSGFMLCCLDPLKNIFLPRDWHRQGWRNKLPWMENSFLEESPLSCLKPETRQFPSEVQKTVLDCSHKSSSFPHASTQQRANRQRSLLLDWSPGLWWLYALPAPDVCEGRGSRLFIMITAPQWGTELLIFLNLFLIVN